MAILWAISITVRPSVTAIRLFAMTIVVCTKKNCTERTQNKVVTSQSRAHGYILCALALLRMRLKVRVTNGRLLIERPSSGKPVTSLILSHVIACRRYFFASDTFKVECPTV